MWFVCLEGAGASTVGGSRVGSSWSPVMLPAQPARTCQSDPELGASHNIVSVHSRIMPSLQRNQNLLCDLQDEIRTPPLSHESLCPLSSSSQRQDCGGSRPGFMLTAMVGARDETTDLPAWCCCAIPHGR